MTVHVACGVSNLLLDTSDDGCSIAAMRVRTQTALATACMFLLWCAKPDHAAQWSDQSAGPAGRDVTTHAAATDDGQAREGNVSMDVSVPGAADTSGTAQGRAHQTKHGGVLFMATVGGVHVHIETVVQPDGGGISTQRMHAAIRSHPVTCPERSHAPEAR